MKKVFLVRDLVTGRYYARDNASGAILWMSEAAQAFQFVNYPECEAFAKAYFEAQTDYRMFAIEGVLVPTE